MNWTAVNFDWNRARAFLATAEEGSFSAAARALGTTQPTIGRQVAALEAELEVVLFERVGRGVRLTPTGLELVEHIRAMGEAAGRVALTAAGRSLSMEGVVVISASEVISAYLLPPLVQRIRQLHPGIEIEIVATNQTSDLGRREADIAVRSYRPTEPELIAVKLGDHNARLYATPAYLDGLGVPMTAAALSRGAFIGFDRKDLLLQGLNAIGLSLTQASFPIVTQNHLVQWALAKDGAGICIMMEVVGDADPSMRRALETLPPIPVPMWLTSHRALRTSRRTRVVFDLMVGMLTS